MKKTIQTKRNATAGAGFRKLHAKTTARKRKLRAATAVADPHIDLESDVPNVGIGRALIVILVIHVVAIAVIYLHSTFIGNQPDEAVVETTSPVVVVATTGASSAGVANTGAAATGTQASAALVAPAAESRIDPNSGRYWVGTGDTYALIAANCNVDETALRALNGSRPLRGGVLLDLPAQLSSRPVAVHETPMERESHAVAAVVVEPVHARAIVVEEESSPHAVVVAAPAVATTLADSGQRYTVKSGDTVWRIASRYKVSRENLLKINGISDPRKLGAGKEIKIPTH